jgi:DNA-binding transcriptional ArsR family regulator
MPATADRVFKALADRTRLGVIEHLGRGAASVGELARRWDMKLPSFVLHLKVLEDAGLVRSTKAGRVRTYRLNPAGMKVAEDWLAKQRALWERRLNQLHSYLLSLHAKQKKENAR